MIGNLLEKTKFENLNLNSPLLKVLNEEGYDYPTPIQFQTIPSALQGSDILGVAQTGTGKTAAFTLPILQKLNSTQSRDKFRHPKAIILSPTRELTIQINNSIKIYAKYIALKHVAVFGGVKQGPQVALLNKGVDIIVATPGRLLDLINQKLCSLEEIKYFVLDEADRMLDMGFIRDVEKIVNLLPKKRQSLFFSATMPKMVAKLADNILKNPKKVKVKSSVTPIDRISQSVIVIEPQEKISQLVTLLNDNSLKSVIVFIKTKHKANRVCQKLTQIGIVTDVIHSNKSQSARQKALNDFKEGKIKILLATDIAARGIDVEAVSHIINFDMPSTPEDYVHRIGRTARAGANGIAISLCEPSERLKLFRIEELINIKLNVIKSERSNLELIENFSENNQNSNKSEVRNTNFSKIKKIKSLKVVAKKTKSIIKRNAKKDKLKSKKIKVKRKING